MVSVTRPWRAWKTTATVATLVAVVGIAAVVVPTGLLLLEGRPIDTTVAHGDDCLPEAQGAHLRCWDVFVPDDLPDTSVPLLVDIHGFLNTTDRQRRLSDFERLATTEGFVLVRPYGIEWSWNGGGDPWPSDTELEKRPGIGCCGHALNEQLDDVGFIVAMIDQLQTQYAIDGDRIFLSGFSNGCILAQRVAAQASASIDGVACMAGHLLADVAADYDPVRIMEIHGTADAVAEYDPGYWPGSVANFDAWRERNGCDDAVTETWRDGPHHARQADGCDNDATVVLVTLEGFGHAVFLDEGWLPVDTTRLAWDFLAGTAS